MSLYLTLIAFDKGFRCAYHPFRAMCKPAEPELATDGRLSPLAATGHPGFGKIAIGHRRNHGGAVALPLTMETASIASATSRWFDDNFSTRSSAHLHRPTARRTIPGGRFPGSSPSSAVIPTAVSQQPAYLRSRARDSAEILADCLQGRVEQATRDSWVRSGLRISPFRLLSFARLGVKLASDWLQSFQSCGLDVEAEGGVETWCPAPALRPTSAKCQGTLQHPRRLAANIPRGLCCFNESIVDRTLELDW
ncbi:hypothetical protein C8R47DRAFT_1080849 [Mycena vitilis]|nr:hypothetical protein C8R47DRAFT_1080849 [Mycena vitilis]